jgi:aldehyde dehydrogenase (NAD+)
MEVIMNISRVVAGQREYFETGKTLNINRRIAILKQLRDEIKYKEQKICRALKADLGKSASESYMCEIGLTLSELDYQIDHIKSWSRRKYCLTEPANMPASSFTVMEPYGVVLIMAPWNYPFLLCMEPLAGAIAAGNCCVLKPSAYSPATSAVIREITEAVFPRRYVAVVEGVRQENASLLEERFDYIFFTGGVTVGQLVMEKASKNLTPISLELGGKSPCIVDRTCDIASAAKRIAFGKYTNCGQTCVAPDYILIDRTVKDEFLKIFIREIRQMYGEYPLHNPSYGRIVNRKHFDRLMGLIDTDKLVCGGGNDPMTLKIEPTVMDNVTAEDPVMKEEIFGPIMPVIAYDGIGEAFEFVRLGEKPLAAYLFTTDKRAEQYFLKHISFGGGCINDTLVHLASSHMGFGGVGHSGMGSYHGYRSFETFSHRKSILKRPASIEVPIRYQPYTDAKDKLIHMFLK